MRLLASLVLICTYFTTSSGSALVLTSTEKLLLVKLRENVEKIVTQPYMLHDTYLIGWLRAEKNSVSEATETIRKAMEWRKERRMDTILDEVEPWKELRPLMPYRADGIAKDGTPVLETLVGKWDIRKFVLTGKGKLYPHLHARMFEEISNKSRQIGQRNPNVRGFYCLVDLSGYNIRMTGCTACVPLQIQIIKNLETYYSKDVQLFYGLNTPRIFHVLYNVLQNFLSEETRQQWKFFGLDRAEWLPMVLELIPKDQLLVSLGGTKV